MLKHLVNDHVLHCTVCYTETNLQITCRKVPWVLIVPVCTILTLATVVLCHLYISAFRFSVWRAGGLHSATVRALVGTSQC